MEVVEVPDIWLCKTEAFVPIGEFLIRDHVSPENPASHPRNSPGLVDTDLSKLVDPAGERIVRYVEVDGRSDDKIDDASVGEIEKLLDEVMLGPLIPPLPDDVCVKCEPVWCHGGRLHPVSSTAPRIAQIA